MNSMHSDSYSQPANSDDLAKVARQRREGTAAGAEARMTMLGLSLAPPRPPVGTFAPAVRHGRLCFLSGQGPVDAAGVRRTGLVGGDVSVTEARDHARLTMLNLLSAIRAEIGSLDRITRIIRLFGMVNAAAPFDGHAEVISGATEILCDVFGPDAGRGAGVAVGLGSLPSGITVEIEMVVAVDYEEE